MRLLAFSDLHRNIDGARRLVERSTEADVVVAAGDLAVAHSGLEETVSALSSIDRPTVLVPGNNETDEALRAACEGWDAATVLHGEDRDVAGTRFFGLGAGVPVTPWDWSFDLTEEAAERELADMPEGCVLVVHSPPKGHCDASEGKSLGSEAVLRAIEEKQPAVAVCGHIHEAWGEESRVGETRVVNLGPEGALIEV